MIYDLFNYENSFGQDIANVLGNPHLLQLVCHFRVGVPLLNIPVLTLNVWKFGVLRQVRNVWCYNSHPNAVYILTATCD